MTTVKLEFPIEAGGRTITELHIRRPKTRDMKLLDKHKGNIAGSVQLISHLTELAPEDVEELDGKDYAALTKVIADFFE